LRVPLCDDDPDIRYLMCGKGGTVMTYTGRNIKIPGHALKPMDPNNRYKWECYCGASGTILAGLSAGARERGRRIEHDNHKENVLRSQGKWEENEDA